MAVLCVVGRVTCWEEGGGAVMMHHEGWVKGEGGMRCGVETRRERVGVMMHHEG